MPPLADDDMKHATQPSFRVVPRLRAKSAQNRVLGTSPERPGGVEGSPAFRGEPHRLDPPVGMRAPLDQAIALEEAQTAREGRLVDGEYVFELFQVRLARASDGCDDAELCHAQPARP